MSHNQTPGLWKAYMRLIRGRGWTSDKYQAVIVSPETGQLIAQFVTNGSDYPPLKTTKANVKLMGEAPRLLAELRRARKLMASLCSEDPPVGEEVSEFLKDTEDLA